MEMLVALLGVAIVLNMLFASIGGSLKAERTADLRMSAVRLAASQRAVVEMTEFDELMTLNGVVETTSVRSTEFKVKTTLQREGGGSGPDGTEERYAVKIRVDWNDGMRCPVYEIELKRSKL